MPTRSVAVLASWSEFKPGTLLRELPHTRRGLERLTTELSDCLQLSGGDVRTFDSPAPGAFLNGLQDIADERPDVLLVHLASHGLPRLNSLYLATAENRSCEDWYNALSVEEVLGVMTQCEASVKVLMVDSCFAGLTAGGLMGPSDSPEPVEVPDLRVGASRPGVFVLMSCSGEEVAHAPLGHTYTVFTGAIIQAFGPRDDRDLRFSTRELTDLLVDLVAQKGAEEGRTYPVPRFVDPDGIGDERVFWNTHHSRFTPHDDTEKPTAGDYRVLVVDDQAQPLRETMSTLRTVADRNPALRIDVVGASSESEAREELASHYDLAVIDLFLQNGPAIDLLQTAKLSAPNIRTIVLTRSTHAPAGDLDKALPRMLDYPPTIDGFFFKGDEQDPVKNILLSEAARRGLVLGRVHGLDEAEEAVVERLRRRKRIPIGVPDSSIKSEVRASVCGLFSRWLGHDSGESDALRTLVTSVRVEAINEGKSSCVAFFAKPQAASAGLGLPSLLVMKIGPRSEIAQELDRYHRYVEIGVPLKQRTDLLSSWIGTNLGAILYSFLGANSSSGVAREIRQTPVQESGQIIANLFEPSGMSWYKAEGLDSQQFFPYFRQFGFDKPEAREAVGLLNRSIDKLNRDRLDRLPSLSASIVESGYLSRGWPTTLIHGDLHLGNVVAIGPDEAALIDYRNVGPGPRCLDFCAAELWLMLNAQSEPLDYDDQFGTCRGLVAWLTEANATSPDLDGLPAAFIPVKDHIGHLRQYVSETFETRLPVANSEYLTTLLVVALRRSRFKALAKSKWEQAWERVVLCGTVLGCTAALEAGGVDD